MHYPDLSRCDYGSGPHDAVNWAVPLLAVGWLEHPHDYPKGRVLVGLVERIFDLLAQTDFCYTQHHYRGQHSCSLCAAKGIDVHAGRYTFANIFVPGDQVVYVAPGGITHYIMHHGYSPPAAFVAAIVKCPDINTLEYRQLLQCSNRGNQPPLETDQISKRRRDEEMRANFLKTLNLSADDKHTDSELYEMVRALRNKS